MQNLETYLTKEGWRRDWELTNASTRQFVTNCAKVIEFPWSLYRKNRYVNMNANVIAASIPSIILAGYTSDLLDKYGASANINSLTTAAVDWTAYIPINIMLHYASNKEKFTSDSGVFNCKNFLKDVGRIYRTKVIPVALFYIIAGPAHNICLRLGLDGFLATQASYWGTMILTRSVHTALLYNSDKKNKLTTPITQ